MPLWVLVFRLVIFSVFYYVLVSVTPKRDQEGQVRGYSAVAWWGVMMFLLDTVQEFTIRASE